MSNRASYQNHSNLSFGTKNKPLYWGVPQAEKNDLAKAVRILERASRRRDETAFIADLTEAFRLVRNTTRNHIL